MKKNLICFIAIAFSWLITSGLFAQENVNFSKPLSVDPDVVMGKLDNGLTYYIRKNAKPEHRVEMRLAVNTGSLYEDETQQGLAHFTEHMCFNGTKNFPKNELVSYLQSLGIQFGPNLNAYTSFGETVYQLQVPSDKEDLVEKGYQVLEDWAHNLTLDNKEIDKERGIITEEWRLGLGADDRMMKRYIPVILKDSRYAERLPIGKPEIIKNFKYQTLKDFYYDWYRPDLMAVVIVGDVDVKQAENQIKTHFSQLTNPSNEKKRTEYGIPDNKEPLIAIETDKEATNNMVSVFYKHQRQPVNTVGDFRYVVMQDLYNGMLNNRLNEIMQKPDAPFVYAYTGYGDFIARTQDAYVSVALVKENQIEKGLETLLAENERVKRFGFTATELERQKEEILSQYEQAAKESDKTESVEYVSDYLNNYLDAKPIPGPKNELEMVKSLLPDIQLADINVLPKQWVSDDNIALLITAPQKEGIQIPSKEKVLEILKNSTTQELTAYVDKFSEAPLFSQSLAGSKVSKRVENKEYGFTEITLANGIRVVMKPTVFKNDEILFSAVSPGGNSLYPDQYFMSSFFASQIVSQSGVGKFDNVELEKKLKGKVLKVNPYISDVKEGFSGSAAPQYFETMLQLTYLYFTAPRQDTTVLKTFLSKTKNQLKFIKNNPMIAFYDTLMRTCAQSSPRVIVIPSEEQLDQIKMAKLFEIYKDRFADAGDFTFFIVGNFAIDSILPVVQSYIGSLPVTHRTETWKDVSPEFPEGIKDVSIYKGTEPKSMVGIVMAGKFEWNDKNRMELRMLKEVLSIKLLEVIREKMSGVYSPQVQLMVDKYPRSEYSIMTIFGCSPKNTDKLTKAVFKEIKKIQKKGPTLVDLNKVKELLIREHETDVNTNSYWLEKIESSYFNGDDLTTIPDFNERVNAITISDLQLAAQNFMKRDHYVRTVLLPEKKK